MGIFKTRDEYEQEQKAKYNQRLKNDDRRRIQISTRDYQCRVEGCGDTFQDVLVLYAHIEKHNEEMRKALVCNQPKCGKKCGSRKEYKEHVEEHKSESKRKIKNSIRAVLLYNKHGLLLEAFEVEFKRHSGRSIPYKFLGYDSLYDLVSNMPDVVRVVRAGGGNSLLFAVPDEKTMHVASLVGNQRDNAEGFNRKTANFVARLDAKTRMKISAITADAVKDRKVSDFVQSQIRDLLRMDSYLNGIQLSHLAAVYDREFGYKIDWEEFGFSNVEDFCLNGLKDVVDVDLDFSFLKIVEKGVVEYTKSIHEVKKIPMKLITNIKQMLTIEKNGVNVNVFKKTYEESFEYINVRNLGFSSMKEFCLFLPNIMRVSRTEGGDFVCYPALEEPSKTSVKSDLLRTVADNVAKLLEGHKAGIEMETLVRGYDGFHERSLSELLSQLELETVESLLELCSETCHVERTSGGRLMVSPAGSQVNPAGPRISPAGPQLHQGSSPSELSVNLRQLVQSRPGGVRVSQLPQLYLQHFGSLLSPPSLGFQSLLELVKSQELRLVVEGDRVRAEDDGGVGEVQLRQGVDGEDVQLHQGVDAGEVERLEAGWARVLSWSPGVMLCQLSRLRPQLARLEQEMAQFYSGSTSPRPSSPQRLLRGDLVAALHIDLGWHRARLREVGRDWLEVQFLDWGWLARLRPLAVRPLHSRFQDVRWQAVTVRCREVSLTIPEADWQLEVRRGRARLRLQDQGGLWTGQLRVKSSIIVN